MNKFREWWTSRTPANQKIIITLASSVLVVIAWNLLA